MCGICGFYFNKIIKKDAALESVKIMSSRMKMRGPDGEGIWSEDKIVLGHRRLAIQDLKERSNQPFLSRNGRFVLVFNGEIYNFRELRKNLISQGVIFYTTSDTEVLLEMYVFYGTEAFKKLRGMFSIGIWDKFKSELILARDPYGIKPLYYSNTEKGFLFASQVKAILAANHKEYEKESAGLAGFYLWGSVPEPWTLYRNIFSLPPGSYLKITESNINSSASLKIILWDDIRDYWNSDNIRSDDLQSLVKESVTSSVKAHLVSDVPVGVFLSSGVDSTVIAAIASELGYSIEGITVSFDEFSGKSYDEVPIAKKFSQQYGIKHHIRKFSQNEFNDSLIDILDAMDQPSIDGVNTWFASKAASELGFKVVLSGIGGDEIFCGYDSFKTIPLAFSLRKLTGSGLLLRALMWMLRYSSDFKSHPKYKIMPRYLNSLEDMYLLKRSLFLPEELSELMGSDLAKEGVDKLSGDPAGIDNYRSDNNFSRLSMLESTMYLRNQLLRDSDWASMAHSIELRTPLVDVELLKSLAPHVKSFKGSSGKVLLGKSTFKPLPKYILDKHKTGFSTPISNWIKDFEIKKQLNSTTNSTWARRWAISLVDTF